MVEWPRAQSHLHKAGPDIRNFRDAGRSPTKIAGDRGRASRNWWTSSDDGRPHRPRMAHDKSPDPHQGAGLWREVMSPKERDDAGSRAKTQSNNRQRIGHGPARTDDSKVQEFLLLM